jgi:sugar phosphate isomerase/epimerase
MQLALCHFSYNRRFEQEGWSLERLLDEVRALDLTRVDIHAGLTGDPDEAAPLLRKALARTGLTLSGVSLSNNFCAETPEEDRRRNGPIGRWLEVAAELRAPVYRIFGGRLSPEQRADPARGLEARQRTLDALARWSARAAQLGLVLGLENHGGLPCTAEEQVSLLREVGSPALRATVDIGNYLQGGQEAVDGVCIAAPLAAYVHVKDFRKTPCADTPWGWRAAPCGIGEGDVDIAACLAALRAAGYAGDIALEYEGPGPEATGDPQGVAQLRRLLRPAGALTRQTGGNPP